VYDENGLFDSVESDGVSISGFGLGLDLGGAYSFLDNKARVSLAFTDIGFISWSGNNSIQLQSPDIEVRITPGKNLQDSEGETINDQITALTDDLREAINFKDSGKNGRSTSLHTNMNIGLEYEVWTNNLSVGLLYSTFLAKTQTLTDLMLSANYKPAKLKWLSAALSYSFINSEFNTVGLALHITPGKGLNFFVGSDYCFPHVNKDFLPTSGKAANFQMGFSIPL
jgi:hypothetical protein